MTDKMIDIEKIAKSAANTWCRCFKCDGIVNSTHQKCEKDKYLTCHKWYDGYRTALLALDAGARGYNDYEKQMMKNAKDGVITFDYYGDNDKIYGCIAHDSFSLEELGLKDGDKVKLIIIKEEE